MIRLARSTLIPALTWLQHCPHVTQRLPDPCAGLMFDNANASSGCSVYDWTWSTWFAPAWPQIQQARPYAPKTRARSRSQA